MDWIYRAFEEVDLRNTIVYCDEDLKRLRHGSNYILQMEGMDRMG